MKSPRPAVRDSLEFNMTPMIDVSMLLIVFFLLASHLGQQEQTSVDVPSAVTSRPADETTERRVVVSVLPGEILLAGKRVDIDEFRLRMAAEKQLSKGKLQVLIRTDRGTPYSQVEPLLVACAKAGVWNVEFGVLKKYDDE